MTDSKITCFAAMLLLGAALCLGEDIETEASPQPGPANGGLRLRLVVDTEREAQEDVFHVRVDLTNVTDKPIIVSADWPYDQDKGDFEDYFESAVSILTHPEIMFWGIQVRADHRKHPQPQRTLAANESFTVKWTSKARRLKNKLIRPLANMNPYLPSDGLYGVHAQLLLHVAGQPTPVLLRSNEQLVPVGGSNQPPKHSIARLLDVSEDHKKARISLGSLHGIEIGDQFMIRKAYGYFWRLTVTEAQLRSANATLEAHHIMENIRQVFPAHAYPKRGDGAGLIPEKISHNKWMSPTR